MSASDDVQALGAEFWSWRRTSSFRSGDDIPRMPRPDGWLPRLDEASIEERRRRLAGFTARWHRLDVDGAPVGAQIDHRLLWSALSRVRWELEVLRTWERDAVFLTGQVLGPWFDLLLPRPPFARGTQEGLVRVLRAMPGQVAIARAHLTRAGVAPTARVAHELLDGIGDRLTESVSAVQALVDADIADGLTDALPAAVAALHSFRSWLGSVADSLDPGEAVGRERFVWFLCNVALVAAEPEELVRAAEQDYRRAVVAETLTRNRYRDVPGEAMPADVPTQVARQAELEQRVRDFSDREGLLSQPASLGHYRAAAMPPYLEPLQWLGVTDDLTDEHRLHLDAVSYIPAPGPGLPYFDAANARDPRLGIVHEGAHHQQLARAAAHPDPLRRRYYDSTANEGIAFYNEEMMQIAGLFADAPHSEEVIHNFNRLRSLRVIADVNLATGRFSLEEAVRFFVDLVPMDRATALDETAMYVATPGMAMSYHVGKQQLLRLMTDAIRAQGESFSLRAFHDRVWREGNVPFSLQRWELLGDRSEVDVLDAARSESP